jgi:vacuole morphology and inheritance protein 14
MVEFQLGANNRLVQEAVLKWVIIISQESMGAVFEESELIKSCVLAFLSDETCSDDIIFLALDVMGILCTREDIFNDFMKNFVGILSTYKPIRRLIGEMIRPLCSRLDAVTVIRSLAEIIPQHDEDLQFVSHMVYEVNMVLLTSVEMASVRDSIRRSHEDHEGQELFRLLFPCWIRNSVSAISLSLLAQAYDLSASIIREMYVDRNTFRLAFYFACSGSNPSTTSLLSFGLVVLHAGQCLK